MHALFKNIDFSITHCAALPRLFPSRFPVQSIGYISEKTERVRRTFGTCNFSFILSGAGDYHFHGTRHIIESPCVLTQWPGEFLDYGPPRGGTWDELYVIYQPAAFQAFLRGGLLNREHPVWPVRNTSEFGRRVAELHQLLALTETPSAADRIDRVCELLVVESLMEPAEWPEDERLRDIARRIAGNPGIRIDWRQEEERAGMSAATFRRHWQMLFGMPPGKYLQDARIRRARRLLVETNWPVKRIADECGFDDALYFSRRFAATTGLSARTYRAKHRVPRGA